MKYANKLMLVPYIPKIENPTETQLTDLDSEMDEILKNKSFAVSDKVKFYTQTLIKFKNNIDTRVLNENDSQNNYIELVASQIANKIDDKIPKTIQVQETKSEPSQKGELNLKEETTETKPKIKLFKKRSILKKKEPIEQKEVNQQQNLIETKDIQNEEMDTAFLDANKSIVEPGQYMFNKQAVNQSLDTFLTSSIYRNFDINKQQKYNEFISYLDTNTNERDNLRQLFDHEADEMNKIKGVNAHTKKINLTKIKNQAILDSFKKYLKNQTGSGLKRIGNNKPFIFKKFV